MTAITTFGLLTKASMSAADRGRKFFELLQATAPGLLPRTYDAAEPFEHVFDPSRIDDALKLWPGPLFFWETVARGGEGSYIAGVSLDSLDSVGITIDSGEFNSSSLIELMKILALEFQAEFERPLAI